MCFPSKEDQASASLAQRSIFMKTSWSKTEAGRLYFRKRYHENKELCNLRNKASRKKRMDRFYAAIGPIKCSRCPESDIACLDFHHRNPAEKTGEVAYLARVGNLERALEEFKKCDVLCANCHRKLHYYE